ncbi:hypothetical protein MIMGU_mgv1a015845mg [Erythranthe guttata]|uniref:Uncharacterized protein n=1 Tax=Erythranthe guttata TaxID=4155 RepID=A0A022RFR1_ERYGU|nr:hypothetical protein MIMGU_mgv1a015845mg [Erythranthe guttata]
MLIFLTVSLSGPLAWSSPSSSNKASKKSWVSFSFPDFFSSILSFTISEAISSNLFKYFSLFLRIFCGPLHEHSEHIKELARLPHLRFPPVGAVGSYGDGTLVVVQSGEGIWHFPVGKREVAFLEKLRRCFSRLHHNGVDGAEF